MPGLLNALALGGRTSKAAVALAVAAVGTAPIVIEAVASSSSSSGSLGQELSGSVGSCPAGVADASCVAGSRRGGLASESVLLQRAVAAARASQVVSKHKNADADTSDDPMVNDDEGFEGGDIDEIEDTGCEAVDVRRRRRADTMCSCRRRDSGRRSDGGWVCQNDRMVQEPPEYTNPIWAEEFDDERGDGSLNESRWELLYTGSGNGNKEDQFYTNRLDNLKIEDGVLKIVGKPEGFEWKSFTSGKIQTRNKGDWGPGVRIEVRAKLPLGVGTWPAIWMMPTEYNYGNWPESGEIDIMEALGRSHGKVFGTIHTGAYNHMKGTHKGKSFYTDFSEWHTYALNWYEDRLEWYADGNLYNTFAPDNVNDYGKWPFNRRFYLILNLALGGNLGGGINFAVEQVMEVDYARVFCLDGSTTCAGSAMEKITCCSKCPGKKYCSQRSGNCYDEKRSDYYDTCDVPVEPKPTEPPAVALPPSGEPPVESSPPTAACCSACGGQGYCSPRSNRCYPFKRKDYYERCFTGPAPCCSSCGDSGFCSPVSKKCYSQKRKNYYESCSLP